MMCPVSQTRRSVKRNPTRRATRSSLRLRGPSGSDRVGHARRTNSGEQSRIKHRQARKLQRLGDRDSDASRARTGRRHPASARRSRRRAGPAPRDWRVLQEQVGGKARVGPRGVECPLGEVKTGPDEELDQDEREKDRKIVDEDESLKPRRGEDQPRPADDVNDQGVDRQAGGRQQPRAPGVSTPDRVRGVAEMRDPRGHPASQPEGEPADREDAATDRQQPKSQIERSGSSAQGASSPKAIRSARSRENGIGLLVVVRGEMRALIPPRTRPPR